jgi:hypothetical protein
VVNSQTGKLSTPWEADAGRPTRFIRTRLWGTNLADADMEFCELHNFDSIDLRNMQQKIDEGKLRIVMF